MNILYSLQHLGYVIPPQADAGWIGEAGPGPELPRPGLRRPGERLHEPQHDVHDVEPAAPRADAQGRGRDPGARQPALGVGRGLPPGRREPRAPLSAAAGGRAGGRIRRVGRLGSEDVQRALSTLASVFADPAAPGAAAALDDVRARMGRARAGGARGADAARPPGRRPRARRDVGRPPARATTTTRTSRTSPRWSRPTRTRPTRARSARRPDADLDPGALRVRRPPGRSARALRRRPPAARRRCSTTPAPTGPRRAAATPRAAARRARPRRRAPVDATPEELLALLGLTAFRPGQREAVQAALDGRDASS